MRLFQKYLFLDFQTMHSLMYSSVRIFWCMLQLWLFESHLKVVQGDCAPSNFNLYKNIYTLGTKKRRHLNKCAVVTCSSPRTQSYHKFPTDPILANLWQKRAGVKSFSVKSSRICGNHFEESSFKSCYKSRLLAGVKIRKQLEKSAVPTLNIPGLRRESSASRAAQIQSRKRLIEQLLGKISI